MNKRIGVIDIASYTRLQPWVGALRNGLAWGWEKSIAARGQGSVIGLVDAGIEAQVADLATASVQVRSFAQRPATARALRDHGTCSASLLVGQGAQHVLGVAPRAQLHVATVSEDDGHASPRRVAAAIDWLTAVGATTVAVPMGDDEDDGVLAEAVARASAGGVVVVAAWGDDPGGVPMFPARHPAVRAVAAPPDLAIPAVGGDGRRRMCRGSSVACVLVAGFLAAARAKGLRL